MSPVRHELLAGRGTIARAGIALFLAACGASDGAGTQEAPAPSAWASYGEESGLFTVSVAPGLSARVDGGEGWKVWEWWADGGGAFSVYSGGTSGTTADGLIEAAEERGDRIDVEIDEETTWRGRPAHRLRATIVSRSERAMVQDPETGERRHEPETTSTDRVEWLFFTGDTPSIRAGYRVPAAASPDTHRTFETMLASFALTDGPP